MKMKQRTKDVLAWTGIFSFALIVTMLASVMVMAEENHSHAWLLSSSSSGVDAFGNPTKICNWRCASDRSHTTITSGQVCTYPY